jgi:hypothetical protein
MVAKNSFSEYECEYRPCGTEYEYDLPVNQIRSNIDTVI